MGQCGCGDFYPQFTLPGPDGSVYALQLFNGCHDCRAPAGIVINKLSGEQLDMWEIEHIPKLELRPTPDHKPDCEFREACLVTVDVEKLAKYIGFEDDLVEVYRGLAEARGKNP